MPLDSAAAQCLGMRIRPLPRSLSSSRLRVGEALARGVTANRLNASDLDTSVWGVRGPRHDATIHTKCALIAARLDDRGVFSHSTAALLFGVSTTLALDAASELHVSVTAPARAPHARGLHGHSLAFENDEFATIGGLRATSPERTWCDLAAQLDLLNLIAAGDVFINRRLPLTTLARIEACLRRHPYLKNVAVAREALALLDGGAESRPESFLRVILNRGGLPRPRINHSLVNTESGTVLRPDFEFTEYRTLLEYQGDHHRTKEQWRKDMTRRSRLEAAGWTVIEINADDLRDANELVERIALTLRRHGWRGRTQPVFARIEW